MSTIIFVVVAFVVLGLLLAAVAFMVTSQKELKEEVLPYRLKKFFFSKSEQQFFKILEQQIDHTRYTVFTKVRLGDFVEVDAPKGERMPHWNRIKSKHVDFLIYDTQSDTIVAAIELDGNSHNGDRMKKSDDFKDKLYPIIGVKLSRVRVGSDFSAEIQSIINEIVSDQ